MCCISPAADGSYCWLSSVKKGAMSRLIKWQRLGKTGSTIIHTGMCCISPAADGKGRGKGRGGKWQS